ncbi:hypothetical protein V5O48_010226 [Marasmius crinis-equi]|uniref:Protein kinase domain-containing protein n=1 Tax=Marasmius crinis-equi TaxID=585013 RepID=A0ABR3F944_9AGAR
MSSNPGARPNVAQDETNPRIRSFEDLRVFLFAKGRPPPILEFSEAWSPVLVADWLYEELKTSQDDRYVRRCRNVLDLIAKKHHEFPSMLFVNEIKPLSQYALTGGGFADIYRGVELTKEQTSESMDVKVPMLCLKVLRLHVGNDEEERNKIISVFNFCREAIVWTRLSHSNIHPFLGVNKKHFAPAFCIITPWMENGSVNEFLRKNPSHDKLRSLREIAAGLDYLHSLLPKIVHGDVKGDNVLVAPDHTCRLIDFGLARIVHESTLMEVESSKLHGKGTTRWMAPETLAESQDELGDNTPRDIYAYACTVLEIATGKVPFPELSEPQLIARVTTQGLRPTMPEVPWCPDGVRNLIKQCWETDPSKRPTARDILKSLGDRSPTGERELANGSNRSSDGRERLPSSSSASTRPLTSLDMSISSNTSQLLDLSEMDLFSPTETEWDPSDARGTVAKRNELPTPSKDSDERTYPSHQYHATGSMYFNNLSGSGVQYNNNSTGTQHNYNGSNQNINHGTGDQNINSGPGQFYVNNQGRHGSW